MSIDSTHTESTRLFKRRTPDFSVLDQDGKPVAIIEIKRSTSRQLEGNTPQMERDRTNKLQHAQEQVVIQSNFIHQSYDGNLIAIAGSGYHWTHYQAEKKTDIFDPVFCGPTPVNIMDLRAILMGIFPAGQAIPFPL